MNEFKKKCIVLLTVKKTIDDDLHCTLINYFFLLRKYT